MGRRFAARGWKVEGRNGGKGKDRNKGRGGRGRVPLHGKGVERGGEEGKGRRNGELTLTSEPLPTHEAV